MKKFVLSIILVLSVLFAQAQARTHAQINLSETQTMWHYLPSATVDYMNGTTYDTLRYPIFVNKDYPVLFYFNSWLAPIAGTDTTVTINVYGRVFDNQAWTLISACSSTTAVISTTIKTATSLLTEPAYTGTILYDTTKNAYHLGTYNLYSAATTSGKTAIANYYRYIMIEFILAGNDSVGTGVKLTALDLKIFRRYF